MPTIKQTFAGAISVVALLAAGPALAQGRSGGGGPPSGVGDRGPSGFPGQGQGNPSGRGPWGSDGSFNQPGGSFGGSSASTRVLDNSHVNTALGNALAHSGIALPAGGLQSACGGFRNLGQCLSAMHVAQNLNLTGGFDGLKALMTTGDKLKLGSAIQQLSPEADAKAAEKAAKKQANADLSRADDELTDQ
jgi:hypothetical protein